MASRVSERLNRAGERITALTGTMYVAILFAGLAFVSLPAVIASGDIVVMVSWVTQSFLQLVLLPIIIVGQNAQGAKTEARDAEQAREVRALFDQMEAANAARHEHTHRVLKGVADD